MEKDLIILYEDNHVLVALKPQGVALISVKSESDFVDLVKNYLAEKTGKEPGKAFCRPVYNIDKPAGGVVLLAKTGKAYNRLLEQLSSDDFERVFYAISEGKPKHAADIVTNYAALTADGKKLELVPQTIEKAQRVILSYNVLDNKNGFNLIKAVSNEVAQHQVRFQLANAGLPVFGDAAYGTPKKDGLALWLSDLRFVHPVTGKIMTFRIFPPIEQFPWKEFNLELLLKIV